MQNTQKRLIKWAIGIVVFLLIPLVLTLTGSGVDGDGFHWTLFDFVFIFVIMFGSAVTYELVSRLMPNIWYKLAVGVAVLTSLLLVWINAAVGIIGDGPVNLLYFGVLIIGLVSAFVVRFKPQGMFRVLLGVALVQFLIPVITFILFINVDFSPSAWKVIILNGGFTLMYIVSALLFRKSTKLIS